MKVAIIFAFMDFHRKGRPNRGLLQPQIGPLIAGLLPADADIDIINETWLTIDWDQDYDLVFISSMHSDFDRARQISHYWRRRGAKTVYGGIMASVYPKLCQPYFDAVVIGDPEGTVGAIYRDFCRGQLKSLYLSEPYDPASSPVPRFDLVADQQIIPISLEATRGCPFTCEFCALTGYGTRFQARPVERIIRDISEGQRMLDGLVPEYKKKQLFFCDNNIGGNPKYLRELCAALEPLAVRWGSAITFNILSDLELVKAMSRAGCRGVFVGLESFNPKAIADMNKHQNNIDNIKTVIDQCRDNGILVTSGLMLSPTIDDSRYIEKIPAYLRECGLHVPSFVCFECPIPGTPYFHRLARQDEPAFLPNALLRDFNGYTLTVKPKHETIDQFVASYKAVLETVYNKRTRLRKLADDVSHFTRNGFFIPSLVDALHLYQIDATPEPERTYLANSDLEPPESVNVPLLDSDFDSEAQRADILSPLRVTDEYGRLLPIWRESTTVFKAKGRFTSEIRQLAVG